MAMINPVHGLVVPFLCIVTLPLAIFAGITTTLAFSILMFRVALVYVNMAMSFIPRYIMGRGGYRRLPAGHQYLYSDENDAPITPASSAGSISSNGGRTTQGPPTPIQPNMMYIAPGYRSPKHRERGSVTSLNTPGSTIPAPSGSGLGRRSRQPSQGSITSMGSITPINEADDGTPRTSGSWLLRSSGIDRDFEGVGGWRLDDRGDDADWANINSRLELPLERIQRHHHRTPSGDPNALEGSWLMMKGSKKDRSPESLTRERASAPRRINTSPSSSRPRPNQAVPIALTPRDREEGYFGYFPLTSPKLIKKSPL